MSDVDFLVKLRDGAQLIADACTERLENMAPASVKASEHDFETLAWNNVTGTKAPYQQTTKEANQNNETFQTLQQLLREHGDFLQYQGFKYWFHQGNRDIIDRREK